MRAFLALPIVAAALVGCEVKVSDKDIRYIETSDLRRLTENPGDRPNLLLIIDPRPPSRYAQGHIPGAKNIQLPSIDPEKGRDPAISRYTNIIVYGDNPASLPARGMTKRLLAAKYSGVRMYAWGLEEWVANDYAIVVGPEPYGPEEKLEVEGDVTTDELEPVEPEKSETQGS